MNLYLRIKKCVVLLQLSLCCLQPLVGQISDLTVPPGMSKKELSSKTLLLSMPDTKMLIEEDKADTGAWRFGIEIVCTLGLDSFEKKVQADGGMLYNLRIAVSGAKSINLNFGEFAVKPGTQMWVYSADRQYKMGAFTYRNMNRHENFAILPMATNDLIIEILEPLDNVGSSRVRLSGVVAGYKDWKGEKAGFGQSGSCNININCPQGMGWENQRQATLMLLTSNNTRKCTGTLINNTAHDGTPYVITARHCNTATNAIFMFNYQSADCSITDGPTDMVLQGCEIVAQHTFSDFSLLRLDQYPLPDYNPYYAGWDRSNLPSSMVWSIHHPNGDIKKISIDSNAVVSSGYVSQPDTLNNHWKVLDWDLGTTESGSSGSPLFNTSGKFIGQLHGGYAACSNNLSDYYGRFDVSWQYGTTPDERLVEWLDPTATDSISIHGGYFNTPTFQRDLKADQISNLPMVICDSLVSPKISIVSFGSDTVHSFRIEYGTTSPYPIFDWTGTMTFMQSVDIVLPAVSLPTDSTYIFAVRIVNVNGLNDEHPANDEKHKTFERINGKSYVLQFTTDAYAHENSIRITTLSGQTVFFENQFTPNNTQIHPFCLKPACYSVTFTDAGGDGICCNYGQGMIIIKEEDSGQLICKVHSFADTLRFDFCNPQHYFAGDMATAYPNPSWGQIELLLNPDYANGQTELMVIDMHGKVCMHQQLGETYLYTLSTMNLGRGIYTLYLYNQGSGKSWRKKMIVLNGLQ